jgi:hypothetical protein
MKERSMKRFVAAGVTGVLAAGLATTAFAQPKFDSTVTINFNAAPKAGPPGFNFFGKVKSEKNACQPDRKVTLYGQATDTSDPEALGSDRTNGQGEWKVNGVLTSDSYFFAKAKEREISAGVCRGAKSKTLHPG